jgi:predicted nucleic acid-binding Zn ribbon protein
VGIIFKGKGFYVTDNRSKAKSSTAVPKTRDETKSASSSSSPEESKPKKETKSKED